MPAELGTTNVILGIMAALSLLEALLIVGIGVAGFKAYRRVVLLVDNLERHQVAPAMARVNAILDDMKIVTVKVRQETQRLDYAIHATLDRIDDTRDRVRSNLRTSTSAVVGIVRGLRAAIDSLRRSRRELREA